MYLHYLANNRVSTMDNRCLHITLNIQDITSKMHNTLKLSDVIRRQMSYKKHKPLLDILEHHDRSNEENIFKKR